MKHSHSPAGYLIPQSAIANCLRFIFGHHRAVGSPIEFGLPLQGAENLRERFTVGAAHGSYGVAVAAPLAIHAERPSRSSRPSRKHLGRLLTESAFDIA
ncbi:MAG TPA: hypothetical protein VH280_09155 [Verrucomicrobiae bacterium]|jgi:hypothetical protein|nr:hypothetical protein [Verrucomicrobiae bacterium]